MDKDKLYKVIAIPESRGGYLGFWSFVQDDGQAVPVGAVRLRYNIRHKERIKSILAQAKKDYLKDIQAVLKAKKKMALSRAYKELEIKAAQRVHNRDIKIISKSL